MKPGIYMYGNSNSGEKNYILGWTYGIVHQCIIVALADILSLILLWICVLCVFFSPTALDKNFEWRRERVTVVFRGGEARRKWSEGEFHIIINTIQCMTVMNWSNIVSPLLFLPPFDACPCVIMLFYAAACGWWSYYAWCLGSYYVAHGFCSARTWGSEETLLFLLLLLMFLFLFWAAAGRRATRPPLNL